jgi:hypothetical protein
MTGSSIIGAIEDARVTVRTGTVLDSQTSQRTHINARTTSHSDVGTGQVHNDTVVSSSASELTRFFVQEDGGREFEANATNAGFGFRKGHRVSVLYVGTRQNDDPDPVGVINHSTGASRIFENDVKRQISEPTNWLFMLLVLIMMVAGPVVVWKVWGAISDSMRPEWEQANAGELFFKFLTAMVVGVLGGMAVPGILSGLAVKLGLLPKPRPSITSQVLDQVRQAKADAIRAEESRVASPSPQV